MIKIPFSLVKIYQNIKSTNAIFSPTSASTTSDYKNKWNCDAVALVDRISRHSKSKSTFVQFEHFKILVILSSKDIKNSRHNG